MDIKKYLLILAETMEKKISILQALLEATRRQEQIAIQEDFVLEAFEENMDQKDVLLGQIDELDEGFESVFTQIRSELTAKKELYKDDIKKIQELIRKCTDLEVEIQALEARNRNRLELIFAREQKELRQVKANSKVVSSYYNSMRPSQNVDSIFMDQKK
ncbi:MAG: flagellar export chaperone FlgN [Lachnospiraceae bacterium]|nr:flagellar export chaperone FlgN [Lachnospiraceae bacterium]